MDPIPLILNAQFRDAPQSVRMLCYARSSFDHAWLQRRRDDLEVCVAYMREHSVPCVLVEPVDGTLTALQRDRLAQLFPAARAA